MSESDFRVNQRFSGRFEEAHALAEKIVRSVQDLRSTSIVRVAPVVADELERTVIEGSCLGILARTIESSRDGFEVAFRDAPARFETVGRASQALQRSVPSSPCQVLHVVDETPISDRQLVHWLAKRSDTAVREILGTRRTIFSWLRTDPAGSRAIQGWDLHFSRTQAEEVVPELLDRDDFSLLEQLFESGSASIAVNG